jgi:hypothetical protein
LTPRTTAAMPNAIKTKPATIPPICSAFFMT